MVYDLELVAGAYGENEGFFVTINDVNGEPDDLTSYDTVRLVISDMQYSSPPLRNHLQTDPEIIINNLGILQYIPSQTNPVLPAGRYYVQVFRISALSSENIPTQKFSLLVTRSLPIA